MFRNITALLIAIVTPLCLVAQVDKKKTNAGKLYFSTQPFGNSNAGATTSFTSSDFIYGRVETTGGKNLNELLEVPAADKNKTFPEWYLYYIVRVYKNGQLIKGYNYLTTWILKNIKWDVNSLNFARPAKL